MRRNNRRLRLPGLLVIVVVSCADRVGAIDSSDASGASSAPDEPMGSLDDGEPEPLPGKDAPYPYCEYNGGDFEPYCPPANFAHGFSNWHVDGGEAGYCEADDCNACICVAQCAALGSDELDPTRCPVPTSGTATPECFEPQALCFLTCDDGETCPDGMSCVLSPELLRDVCAWLVN